MPSKAHNPNPPSAAPAGPSALEGSEIAPGDRMFPRPALVAAAAGCGGIAAGGVTLVGWAANLPRLADWGNTGICMFANAALSALLLGGGLLLLALGWRRAGAGLGALAGCIGLATLFQHLMGIDLGIDSLLWPRDFSNMAAMAPHRMGPPASLSFTILGAGLALLGAGGRARRWAQGVASAAGLAALAIAGLSLIGYAFGPGTLYSLPRFTGIAMQTSATLAALAVGLLAANPGTDPVRLLMGRSVAAALARRALPVVVLFPVALGGGIRFGYERGWYDASTGSALRSLFEIALLTGLLWWSLRVLRRHEGEQQGALENLERADRQVRDAQAQLQSALAGGAVGTWTWDLLTNQMTADRRLLEIFGLPADHPERPLASEAFLAALEPQDRPSVEAAIARALDPASDGVYYAEYRVRPRPGEVRWVLARGEVEFNKDRRPLRLPGALTDITAFKASQEQVRRGAEMLTRIVDRSPTGFYIVDADFRISHINADSQARAFRSVNPAIGRRLDDAMRILWPEPLATEIIAIFRNTLETGEPYKSPGLISARADLGSIETYEWQLERVTMPDGHHAVVCYYLDTTALREAELTARTSEEALRQSEANFRALANSLPQQLAWMADKEGWIYWYNQRWYDYTGTTLEEMQGWGWEKVHHPEHLPHVLSSWRGAHASGQDWEDTFPLRAKDGTYRWFLSRAVPIRGERGQVTGWFGTNTDITTQRQAWEALRDREQRLAGMLGSLPDAYYTLDKDRRFTFVNDNAVARWGAERGDVIGRHIWEVFPEVVGTAAQTGQDRAMAERVGVEYEIYFAPWDRWFFDKVNPTADGGLAVYSVDITARKRIEADIARHRDHLDSMVQERTRALAQSQATLRRTERLAAMGTLTAGMGHDLANLMLPLGARVAALLKEPLSPAARQDVEGIAGSLTYLRALGAGLRQMAADPTAPPPVDGLDVAEWWVEAKGMVRACLPRHVQLEAEVPAGLPRIRASRAGLTQAVFNLVQNAGEALAGVAATERGTVRLTAALAPPDDKCCPGGVRLTVADDGPGMTPEVAARCFEPYFSTKSRAVSTGMGLALVRGVADHAGGMVEVASTPGSGTVFTLHFPAIVPPAATRVGVTGMEGVTTNAVVDIADTRLAALVGVVMAPLRVEGRLGDGSPPRDAALWITGPRPAAELEAFILNPRGEGQCPEHDGRAGVAALRAVMLLDEPPVAGGGEGAGLAAGRIVYAGRSPAIGAVRDALRKAAALSRQAAGETP